ncbi:MAG: D-alanyl-D-alanine carboxypeptidase [Clostridia bacterium]|nr:D-alanyl-D-alanine carboxypeptidase [Clostridia bacterium]
MKRIKNLLVISLILIIIMSGITAVVPPVCAENGSLEEIVIDARTGEILFEKNADKKASIASLTKILTAITAIENCDVEKEITVTSEMVGIEGSSVYLKEGEKLTIKELLYALMMRSGNDAATAIALSVSGSIKDFAVLMNKTAEKAGSKNSNFVNPHGLEESDHYSTAKDVAYISAYALKNLLFSEIVGTKKKVIRNTVEGADRVLINKNKLLYKYDGADGIKTGYTKVSGRCLASSATRNGVRLICVIINEADTYGRTAALFDRCFEKYKLVA